MRRRTKVGLSAFMLFCHVAAEVIIVEEKAWASLPCPHPVRGGIWSRVVDGKEVNILTAGGDGDIKHMKDPHKRYSLHADKSLYIIRVTTSDSGRYFCNGEAVELMVIPPGTAVREAEEGTRVTLTCPPDDGPQTKTWSTAHTGAITGQQGFHVSPADQTLTITCVEMNHSGLYNCDGKPAVYLHVTKGKTTTCKPKTSVTTDTTTTKKKGRNKNKTTTSRRQETRTSAASTPEGGDTMRDSPPGLVLGTVFFPCFLIIIIIAGVVYFFLKTKA
ncbi:uncharacterized protein ACO6RY_01907 [Pungitius sinensis]